MSTVQHRRASLPIKAATVVLAIAIALIGVFSTTSRAEAASPVYCQCTTYTQRHFNLTANYPNAADWGKGYLQHNGWHTVSIPSPGDIIVVEKAYQANVSYTYKGPTFKYWLANTSMGHVGWIAAVGKYSTGYDVEIRSANSGLNSHYYRDSNCTDVANYWFATNGSAPGTYQFWAHN